MAKMKESDKAKFRTVAVPIQTYLKVKEMAEREERSIARQISVIVGKVYGKDD
jgi:hypothetical protein